MTDSQHHSTRGANERASLSELGTWEWDFASGSMTWSDGMFRLLGYDAETAVPSVELLLARVHPDDRTLPDPSGFAAARRGELIDAEFRIERPDGEVRWVANKGEVFTDAAGRPSWAAGALLDVTRFRTAEAELARRERRRRAIFDASGFGDWRANAEGDIVEAESLSTYTGHRASDLLGSAWRELVHPDDIEAVQDLCAAAMDVRSAHELSFRLRHHTGNYRWVLCRVVPIRNVHGEVEEWVGSVQDIDDRRGAELKHALAAQRLRLAMETARIQMWDYDLRSGDVSLPDNGRGTTGAASLPFSEFLLAVDPEDRPRVSETLERVAQDGESHELAYRSTVPADRVSWLRGRATLVRGAHLGPDSIAAAVIDVTAQRLLETELAGTREQLTTLRRICRALRDLTGGTAWTAPVDGKVDDLPQWRALTGQTADQVRGWGWLNAIHPADRERVREALVRQIGSRTEIISEYRVRSPRGEYAWFRSRAAPLVRDDGTVSEWFTVLQPSGSFAAGPDANVDTVSDGMPAAQHTSGAQVRAARAILRWSVRDLSQASGVSASTIRRLEEEDTLSPGRDLGNVVKIRAALEAAGVRFGALSSKGAVAPA